MLAPLSLFCFDLFAAIPPRFSFEALMTSKFENLSAASRASLLAARASIVVLKSGKHCRPTRLFSEWA